MESIETDDRMDDLGECLEFEDIQDVTMDSKMGNEELKIRDLISSIARPYMLRADLDKDNNREMALVEQKIALEIRNNLNEKYGGCWGAIVGKRFSIGIGLKESDRYGNFKIGIFNIAVFQYNNYE